LNLLLGVIIKGLLRWILCLTDELRDVLGLTNLVRYGGSRNMETIWWLMTAIGLQVSLILRVMEAWSIWTLYEGNLSDIGGTFPVLWIWLSWVIQKSWLHNLHTNVCLNKGTISSFRIDYVRLWIVNKLLVLLGACESHLVFEKCACVPNSVLPRRFISRVLCQTHVTIFGCWVMFKADWVTSSSIIHFLDHFFVFIQTILIGGLTICLSDIDFRNGPLIFSQLCWNLLLLNIRYQSNPIISLLKLLSILIIIYLIKLL
jgi:hypothetical protein